MPTKIPEDTWEQVAAALGEGLSLAAAGRQTGVAHTSISRRLARDPAFAAQIKREQRRLASNARRKAHHHAQKRHALANPGGERPEGFGAPEHPAATSHTGGSPPLPVKRDPVTGDPVLPRRYPEVHRVILIPSPGAYAEPGYRDGEGAIFAHADPEDERRWIEQRSLRVTLRDPQGGRSVTVPHGSDDERYWRSIGYV